ncbi:MAG: hypothetical protein ACERKD_21885 [Prolixibacteraceae bacterium]
MKSNPIVKEIVVPVDVEVVWEALTDSSKMKEWYFEVRNFKLEEGNVFFFFGSLYNSGGRIDLESH